MRNRNSCQPQCIGFNSLCTVWNDPDFNPTQSAVYCRRILESPSCRWNAYQCAELDEDERPETCDDRDFPKTIRNASGPHPSGFTQ